MSASEFELVSGENAQKTPVRVLVVQEDERPVVDIHDDDMVMTFPHLVVRELLALMVLSIVLVLWALLFDAPLEELANPQKTPNPAKAPWYFLGLQELLHYYPPLISGVVLPGLLVVALFLIPYFDVNLERAPFWANKKATKLVAVPATAILLSLVFFVTGSHPVWPLIGPTLAIGFAMLLPVLLGDQSRWLHMLSTRSLPFWIFLWFLISAFVLTIIGVFFRGPGWAFTLPWVDGIYY